MANRKLGKVGNLGNLGRAIPSFPVPEFSILPYSQNRKLGFKNRGKNFSEISEISEVYEFSTWPLFSLKNYKKQAQILYQIIH